MPIQTNMIVTYALLVFIWATTPLAIVWSVTDLHPLWALALRFFLALPFAFVLLWIFKSRFSLDRISLHCYLAGACSFIGAHIFSSLATGYLSSGLIALMFWLSPIISGLIDRFVIQLKLNRSR